jgi:CspA family cold shock protein
MITGTVTVFHAAGKFGFIRPDDGSKDVFLHVTAVQRAGLGNVVAEGQRLSYQLDRGADGEPFAFNLKAV